MAALPTLRLLLATLLLGLVLARGRPRSIPVLLVEEPASRPSKLPPGSSVEPDFAALMTPDDVARGVWALARGMGPGLREEQADPLLQATLKARRARQEVDRLRMQRRQAREDLRQSGLVLARDVVELASGGWR